MSQYGPTIPYVLPNQTFAAGSRTTQTLRDLPKTYLGKLCHLVKFGFGVTFAPTWATTAPDVVGNNNVFTACDFWDGSINRFQGGFNHMRAKERLSAGRPRVPDADTNGASTVARYFRRTLHVGPPQFIGSPNDFVIPTGSLENGELRFTHGGLTDLAGNSGGSVSAATASVRVVAYLMLMDEVRIPPAYQYVNQTASAADLNLSGRALYESIAIAKSTFANWTALDIGNVRLDLGAGDVVPSVNARDLTHGFLDDFSAGEIGVVQGDLDASGDTGAKAVNRNTPTALTPAFNDLQPVLWSPPDTRITKLLLAESVCRLRWDGNASSATILIGRILSQPATVVAATVGKSLGRLNVKGKAARIKTTSKDTYNGDKGEFMPFKVSIQ